MSFDIRQNNSAHYDNSRTLLFCKLIRENLKLLFFTLLQVALIHFQKKKSFLRFELNLSMVW